MKVYEVHENDLMSPSNDSPNWLKRVCLAEEVDEEIERLRKALEYFTNLTWQEAVEVFGEEE